MGKYSVPPVGSLSEFTLDYVLEHSIEDLIDSGKRFRIVKETEEAEESQDEFHRV